MINLLEAYPSWSSIAEWPLRATYRGRSQPERPVQSDYLKSLPARATSSSHSHFDAVRHEETRREWPPGATMLGHSACFAWTIFMLFQGPFGHLFWCFTLSKPKLSTFVSHWRQIISFRERRTSKNFFWFRFHCFHLVFLLISYLFLYMINLKSNMGLRGIMEISE